MTVETKRGRWIYSEPREWYDSLMKMVNRRIRPDDAILGLTLAGWEDIWISDILEESIIDLSIIREELIATRYTCQLFTAPSPLVCVRQPKTVWGGERTEDGKIDDRRSIWAMGKWTDRYEFKINLTEYGDSYKIAPWRSSNFWQLNPLGHTWIPSMPAMPWLKVCQHVKPRRSNRLLRQKRRRMRSSSSSSG